MPPRDAVSGLGAFLLIAGLGFDDGGFAPPSWGWSAVLALVAAGAAAAGGAALRPSRLEVAFLGALAALLVWTLASAAWSLDLTSSVLDAERLLVYLAAAGALLCVARRESREVLLAGGLAGASLLSLTGLIDVMVGMDPPGSASADPGSQDRLSEPLGYANAVALMAAMGALLALALAVHWQRRVLRGVAAGLVPVLLAALYFTYGRGAWLALGIGLLTAILVSPRRRELVAAALALTPPGAAAVAAAAAIGGRLALAPVLLLCAAAAGAVGVALPALVGRFGTREAAALSTASLAVAAAFVVAFGGPVTVVRDAYRSFTDPAAPASGGGARLLTLSGSSRVDYWRVAWQDFENHAAIGSGAGSYRRYWTRNRTVAQPARDAHSLYLETLGELGIVGLVLLLAAVTVPLGAAITARGEPLTTAALAPYVAYLAHAGQDWDWELPAVTITAVVCAAALLLTARRREVGLPRPVRIAVAAVAAVLAVLASGAYAGNRQLVLAERGSEQSARRAGRFQPWSGEPWRLLGEAQLARGDVAGARKSFLEGLERDDDEWELWLDLALAADGRERSNALARAAELNPLAPEIAELRDAP
jgi:O-Antigen ligase